MKGRKTVMLVFGFNAIVKLVFGQSGMWADHSSLHSDYTSNEDKTHLDNMARELYHTMQLQERQLLPLKEENVGYISYQIGLVIGLMREKYKRMMDIYGEYHRRYTGQTQIVGPGVWELKPIHIMIACNEIRMIEMEIYKYVRIDLLLKIHPSELDDTPKPEHMKAVGPADDKMPPVPPPLLRSGYQINQTISTLMTLPNVSFRNGAQPPQNHLTEEDIKRQYRENYMKQHGLDTEWSLDHFYGFA